MRDQPGHESPSREAIELGHEPTSLNIRAILVFTVVFVVATAFVYLVVWWVMIGTEKAQAATDSARSPLPAVQRPQPWLQPSPAQGPDPRQPWQDLQELNRRADEVLRSYGRAPPDQKNVRIPIRRAMEILAERGLPTTQPERRSP